MALGPGEGGGRRAGGLGVTPYSRGAGLNPFFLLTVSTRAPKSEKDIPSSFGAFRVCSRFL